MSDKLESKLAAALDGERLNAGAGFGEYLLSAKPWRKGAIARVYVDGRFIADGDRISSKRQAICCIELLGSGDVVYSGKVQFTRSMPDLVKPILARLLAVG